MSMKKMMTWVIALALIGGVTSCTSCTSNKDHASSVEVSEYIPKAPDYNDTTTWVTADGDYALRLAARAMLALLAKNYSLVRAKISSANYAKNGSTIHISCYLIENQRFSL